MVLDVVIAGLLLVCIHYCWKLNQKIEQLHKARAEMIYVMDSFSKAIENAEESIKTLKDLSAKAIADVQYTTHAAERIADDLRYIHRKGEEAADRLALLIKESRAAGVKITAQASLTSEAVSSPLQIETQNQKKATIESLLERISLSQKKTEKRLIKEPAHASMGTNPKPTLPVNDKTPTEHSGLSKATQQFISSLRTIK